MTRPHILQRFEEVAHRYEAILCDIWGVIFDGVQLDDDSCAALAEFKKTRGPVILLSNAPVPARDVAKRLSALSPQWEYYDVVVTAGDVARAELVKRPGVAIYRIGPDRHDSLFEGLPVRLCPIDEAEMIVCTAPEDDTQLPLPTEGLKKAIGRGIPLLCANPDLTVVDAGTTYYCAGAVARAYESIGGTVRFCGKPYARIYETALQLLDRDCDGANPKILAIGDTIETDIVGAARFGLDTLAVGVRGEWGDPSVTPNYTVPTYAIARLK